MIDLQGLSALTMLTELKLEETLASPCEAGILEALTSLRSLSMSSSALPFSNRQPRLSRLQQLQFLTLTNTFFDLVEGSHQEGELTTAFLIHNNQNVCPFDLMITYSVACGAL